jgi:NADPH:quinone reductase
MAGAPAGTSLACCSQMSRTGRERARGSSASGKAAVPLTWIAELPDGVSFVQAAGLPTAGLTALRILRLGPAILGRRVLVTGASGGVGRFAIQLAHLGGADVTALASSSSARVAGLA